MTTVEFEYGYRSIFTEVEGEFDDDETKFVTFDGLSQEFIQGFLAAQSMYDNNLSPAIISEPEIELIPNHISLPAYMGYLYLSEDSSYLKKREDSFGYLSELYRLGKVTKHYAAVIDQLNSDIKVIQFDSLDFISGFQTCSSWKCGDDYRLEIYAMVREAKMQKFNVEYQIPTVTKDIVKILDDILKSEFGICIIIYDYLHLVKCKGEYTWEYVDEKKDSVKSIFKFNDMQCITVYESDESDTDGRCPGCRSEHTKLKPFLCKVTLS
jgi:hypothetical protein